MKTVNLSLALYPIKQGGIRRPVFFINVCKRQSDLLLPDFSVRLHKNHLKNVFQTTRNDSLRGQILRELHSLENVHCFVSPYMVLKARWTITACSSVCNAYRCKICTIIKRPNVTLQVFGIVKQSRLYCAFAKLTHASFCLKN